MKSNSIGTIFQMTLLFALILSFYIIIQRIFFKNNKYDDSIFDNWQFPMLLAIYLDTIYH